MANHQAVKNVHDGKTYSISIVSTKKRITIPPLPEHRNLIPPTIFNLLFEAAIYVHNPKVTSRPLLVIHVDDGYGPPKDDMGKLLLSLANNASKKQHPRMSEDEFTKLVLALAANETITNLYENKTSVYEKYGYVSLEHDIWSIWFWKKIRHIFLLRLL
jgi:hypothetical protein